MSLPENLKPGEASLDQGQEIPTKQHPADVGRGWTGFNGGDPYTISTDASLTVLDTHVCTATRLLTWLMLDIIFFGKPSVTGTTQGMITGLVCITPEAGVVQGWAAILMVMMSGSIPWYNMMVLHKVWFLKLVDNTSAASEGSYGLFAMPKLNWLFYSVPQWQHYIGLFCGLKNKCPTAGFNFQAIGYSVARDLVRGVRQRSRHKFDMLIDTTDGSAEIG